MTVFNSDVLKHLKHTHLIYELDGDTDTAVSITLDLIQQNPSSLWAWLA